MRVGNKQNSFLNGEWAKHGRNFGKKLAARKRRIFGKKDISEGIKNFSEKRFGDSDND